MTDQLRTITDAQRHAPPATYDDLCALMLSCTLTRSPQLPHAEGLLRIAKGIYRAKGAKTEMLRPVDYEILAGLGEDYTVQPQAHAVWMREAGCHIDFHNPKHRH
ncbi:MAG: hypothetical protein AAF742_08540 [Pseudomonadota bacterium]